MTIRFEIQVILRQVRRMTPKWLWTPQGHMCPIYMLLVSTSPKFCSTTSHFWDKCTEWPQIDLEPYKVKLPIYVYNSHRVSNFTPFHSATSCFQVTGHFDASALNDPTVPLNTSRSKVHHILLVSQISLCFALWPAVKGEPLPLI